MQNRTRGALSSADLPGCAVFASVAVRVLLGRARERKVAVMRGTAESEINYGLEPLLLRHETQDQIADDGDSPSAVFLSYT